MSKNIELMRSWLKEDYPEHSDILLQICLDIDDSVEKDELFFSHIRLAIDYFDKERKIFTTQLTHLLISSYSYLAASFFCLDAIVDGHSIGSNKDLNQADIAKALTLFQLGGIIRLRKFSFLADLDIEEIEKKTVSLFNKNILALNLEEKERYSSTAINHNDYQNIVDRSYLVLFIFDLVAMTCGQKLPPKLFEILQNILYFIQLSDDIGDWRVDFNAERYTPFLKECISKLQSHSLSLQILEEFIYLSGIYESSLAKIVIGFDAIISELTLLGSSDTLLMQYVRYQRDETKKWLAKFMSEKTSFAEVEK